MRNRAEPATTEATGANWRAAPAPGGGGGGGAEPGGAAEAGLRPADEPADRDEQVGKGGGDDGEAPQRPVHDGPERTASTDLDPERGRPPGNLSEVWLNGTWRLRDPTSNSRS